MHRLLPVKQAQTKQGPFAAAGYVVLAGDHYYDPLRRPPGSMRLPVRRLYAPAAPGPQARGRGGPLQFPPPPSARSAPHYGGGFLSAAPSGSSRLPWPSPCYSGLGSPLSPHGAGLTPRQASLHAADRTVAPTNVAFDAGLRRRAFPPDAASLLPGSLTTTWTGLPPAGGDELADTHDLNHQGHRPPIRSRVPSGHAVVIPGAGPPAVLAGQRGDDVDVVGGMPDRHPPHPQIITAGGEPGAVHHPGRDLGPFRIRQHPVLGRGADRAVPDRHVVSAPAQRG